MMRRCLLQSRPSAGSLLQHGFWWNGALDGNKNSNDNSMNRRCFHATRRKEIVPFVVGGIAVVVLARYSLRAIRRMDEEWDDYQWELQQYERKHGKTTTTTTAAAASYVGGTVGIDVGTVHLKLAHNQQVVVNREGSRYTFAGMVGNDGDEMLVGKHAQEKFYKAQFEGEPVHLAFLDAERGIPAVLKHPLEDALSQGGGGGTTSSGDVRPVVVAPYGRQEEFQRVIQTILPHAVVVPEPVAAVWGASHHNLLNDDDKAVLVVDVGGYQTSMSLVERNVVRHTRSWAFGGEDYATSLVNYLLESNQDISEDGVVVQQLHTAAESAVAEFNTQTSVEIHVPYISMDIDTRQPLHLETRVSRSVVEQKVEEQIGKDGSLLSGLALSPHTAPPKDLVSLWVSVLTQFLEDSNTTPMDLSRVLLVGGGAKQSQVEQSLRNGLMAIQGNADNLVVPELSSRSELVVLGAASMLPNYDYDDNKGLVRQET